MTFRELMDRVSIRPLWVVLVDLNTGYEREYTVGTLNDAGGDGDNSATYGLEVVKWKKFADASWEHP